MPDRTRGFIRKGRALTILNELRFEKLIYGGDALARKDGRVWLVPYVLPGELAHVEPTRERPDLARGKARGVIEASEHRVDPRCRHFTRCGGCQYQHATPEYETEQKVAMLREVLQRAKVEPPAEITALSGPAWEYRNRVQLHFDNGRVGYFAAGSNQLVAIEECPVASPRLQAAIGSIARMARMPRWPRFVRAIELFTNETDVQVNVLDSGDRHPSRALFEWCEESMPGALAPSLEYETAAGVFRVSHKSFFQVNRFLIDALIEEAMPAEGGAHALDLYAGVGLFSLALARRFERVTAVEAVNSAVNDLSQNVGRANANVRAVKAATEDYLAGEVDRPDFVLADPPRAGLGKRAVDGLIRLRAPRVAVVSCDPATLARDLAGLVAAGYRLDRITMADLFPRTSHIESVSWLSL